MKSTYYNLQCGRLITKYYIQNPTKYLSRGVLTSNIVLKFNEKNK